jgi:hypothetical protein
MEREEVMTEKIRSKGVIFWGWVFIVFGTAGVLGVFNAQQSAKCCGISSFILHIILSAASLITGVFILKLNEAARRAAILLGVISLLLIPISLGPSFKASYGDATYEKQKKYVIEKVKPEYQKKALADLEKTHEMVKEGLPVIFIILFGIPLAILEILPIIFFTRPKVKEQFR